MLPSCQAGEGGVGVIFTKKVAAPLKTAEWYTVSMFSVLGNFDFFYNYECLETK